MNFAPLLLTLLLSCHAVAQQPQPSQLDDNLLRRAVVARHAERCHEVYASCERRAQRLREAVDELLLRPDADSLRAARQAWIAAREVYGETEALRFQGGPIEEVEPLLNAWPVDEAYIDYVVGRSDTGIVNDARTFRVLSRTLLIHANERGSETNVSVGWHAIEFLLWGQDLDANGPGARSNSDFVAGAAANDRRRAYLQAATDALLTHLQQVRAAWAPRADNFRRRFEQEPAAAVRSMLTGVCILSAFELAGERLAVAYETKEQEQEHSCFSDTTCADLIANQRGIVSVLGGPGSGVEADDPTLLALLRGRDPAVAAHLEAALVKTTKALQAIPQPFDRAFLGDDDAPGRVAIRTAIEALEQQAEAIAIAGRMFGHDLPMRPGN